MDNIALFVGTVILYSVVVRLFSGEPKTVVQFAKRIGLVALLCIPFNVGGNVFTVLGNATAEKSIYSAISLYQKAGVDAVAVLGLAGYQRAGNNAFTLFGISGYQQAGVDAATGIGLAGYQRAGDGDAVIVIGFSGYQRSDRNAVTVISLAGYQRAGDKTRTFGAFSTLRK